MNSCLIPTMPEDVVGDGRWMSMHNRYVSLAKSSEAEVLFIGDSIIQQMQFTELWQEKIQSLHSLNFGIGGDKVENVLWRLKNGELEFNCPPQVVVLFVGTNNDCDPKFIVEGIQECVELITKHLPESYIILPTLLPRGQYPNRRREQNDGVNKLLLETFGEENGKYPNVYLVEIDKSIVQGDQTISHFIMHDYLHLTNQSYTKVWNPVYEKILEFIKLNESKSQSHILTEV